VIFMIVIAVLSSPIAYDAIMQLHQARRRSLRADVAKGSLRDAVVAWFLLPPVEPFSTRTWSGTATA